MRPSNNAWVENVIAGLNHHQLGMLKVRVKNRVALPRHTKENEGALKEALVRLCSDRRRILKHFVSTIDGHILDGADATSIEECVKTFTTPTGIRIVAATDSGIAYPKPRNEDRIVVHPMAEMAMVIDGMGGQGDGAAAAQTIAEACMHTPFRLRRTLQRVPQIMTEKNLEEDSGACVVSAGFQLNTDGTRTMESYRIGDARIIVADTDGSIVFESRDQTVAQEKVEARRITPDQALYDCDRSFVTNFIGTNTRSTIRRLRTPPIPPGYRIILVSDGLTDNLTTEEILTFTNGQTGEESIQTLWQVTNSCMANTSIIRDAERQRPLRKDAGVFIHGLKSKPKRDNRAVVIMDIPPHEDANGRAIRG